MSDTYRGSIELGEAKDVVLESVSIGDLDSESWTADLPSDAVVAGTLITGEMRIRLLDGERAGEVATGQLDVSTDGDRTLKGVTRFGTP